MSKGQTMNTTDGTNNEPLRVPLSDQLGLVAKLRDPAQATNWGAADNLMNEAADEIERLRAELAEMTADRDSWADQASKRTQDALDLVAAEREHVRIPASAAEAKAMAAVAIAWLREHAPDELRPEFRA